MKVNEINNRIHDLKNKLCELDLSNFTKDINANDQSRLATLDYLKNKDAYLRKVQQHIEDIGQSNKCKYYSKSNLKIGIIADEFLYNLYKDAADFISISPDNYQEYADKIDIFFVVSLWRGLNDEWYGIGNARKNNPYRKKLYSIIDLYRSKGVKIVFYSKEDPPNYDIFLDIAKHCDIIFTTASEKIDEYKKDCKTNNVHLLDFGVNPLYHNPIGSKEFTYKNAFIFSGSWYEKYPHRCEFTRFIFNSILDNDFEIDIIDRNYNMHQPKYTFPDEYHNHVYPPVDHAILQKAHKLYDWAINFNSVMFSPTMLANRIYELQAIGNVMISNYAISINNKFPNIFLTMEENNDVIDILMRYTQDEVYRMQMHGVRQVMSYGTAWHRLQEVLDNIDTNECIQVSKEHSIAVVADKITKSLKEDFESQFIENKVLFEEKNISPNLLAKYDMIAFFNHEYKYDEFYLLDMVNAFKYTDCDYITHDSYFVGDTHIIGVEHNFINYVMDKSKTVFWIKSFDIDKLLDMKGFCQLQNGYSIDKFEVNTVRMSLDVDKRNYKLSVIVPVYNNGKHLLGKCFNSLRRSTMFSDMEILLIDDGSTDDYTKIIVNRLTRFYPNVKSFFFEDGGSGSASRPRNKGLELASAAYISYLDPDNEAVNDGYYKLYNNIVNTDIDVIVGNMNKLTDEIYCFKYSKPGLDLKPVQGLINSNFASQSTQALIVNKDFLISSNIDMVVGAIGEDTLFFYELIANSKKVKVIDELIHIYYASVSDSTVNTINKNFYEKYLLLEREKLIRLKKLRLLQRYLDDKYEKYFQGWYVKKLTLVRKEEFSMVIDILHQIYLIYQKECQYEFSTSNMKRFINLAARKKYSVIQREFL